MTPCTCQWFKIKGNLTLFNDGFFNRFPKDDVVRWLLVYRLLLCEKRKSGIFAGVGL